MSEQRTLRIGIASREYVKQRTIEIARGKKLRQDEPRHWVSSFDALARVLSEKNMLLLEMIRTTRPQSMSELAKLSGRAKSNLSKTLHAMESLGLIELKDVERGKKSPTVVYDALQVEYPFAAPPPKLAA